MNICKQKADKFIVTKNIQVMTHFQHYLLPLQTQLNSSPAPDYFYAQE